MRLYGARAANERGAGVGGGADSGVGGISDGIGVGGRALDDDGLADVELGAVKICVSEIARLVMEGSLDNVASSGLELLIGLPGVCGNAIVVLGALAPGSLRTRGAGPGRVEYLDSYVPTVFRLVPALGCS